MRCVVVVKSFISVVVICNPVNRYLFCCFTSCLVTICMNCCLLLFYIAFTNHKMSSQLAKSGIIRGTKIGKSGRYCAVIGCRNSDHGLKNGQNYHALIMAVSMRTRNVPAFNLINCSISLLS